ncbi:neurotensin/neuromedin N [Anolis sagrei]|uniref:neurotensin/neuromedin N n=1 Tax=Anolis sagrei TaxID=38937 RepID=UPI0035206D89
MVQTFRKQLQALGKGEGKSPILARSSARLCLPLFLSPNFLADWPPSLPLARPFLHGLCLLEGERRMATRMLRMQLACAMLLAFASWSVCADSEEEMKALEADLLTNMYTSKVNKAKLPPWKMTLLNICDLISNLNNQEETAGDTEDDLMTRRPTLDSFTLEAMLTLYQLQKVCHSRTFQHWELLQQDVYDPENSSQDKDLMKRKTPYILKRQLHVNKARRPYILKRSSYY